MNLIDKFEPDAYMVEDLKSNYSLFLYEDDAMDKAFDESSYEGGIAIVHKLYSLDKVYQWINEWIKEQGIKVVI